MLKDNFSLKDTLLIATPELTGTCFEKAVIYIFDYSDEETLGIIVNKPKFGTSFHDVVNHLNIKTNSTNDKTIYFGGPLSTEQGFVFHSNDYRDNATIEITPEILTTSSLNIVKSIAENKSPKNSLLAFGYSGWKEDQLSNEIKDHAWLTLPASYDILFSNDKKSLWHKLSRQAGMKNISQFISSGGTA